MFKKIFITLFLLVILACGGLSYYISTIDWNNYKGKITDQIEQITGKKVLIGGKIDLKFWPTPHLSATNIKIYNPSVNSNESLAEVQEMVTDLSLMPLLHKRFEINNMSLVHAKVSVEFLTNGKTNWHSELSGEQSFNLAGVDIAFNSITLQDSVVHILNPTLNLDLTLKKLNADISAQSLSGPFRIDGNFVQDGTPAVFALYVGSLSDSFATSLNLVLTHPTSDSQATFDGSILSNNSEIQGNFTVESKKPSTFLNTVTGQILLPEKYNYPLDGSVELTVNPEQINLSSFIVKYGDDLAGSGKVLIPLKAKEDEKKKVEIAFEMTDFDIMPFVAATTEYLKKLDSNQKNYEPNFEYDVIADITSTRAHYNKETIKNFKFNADFINNVLQIKNLSGVLPGETNVAVKGDVFAKERAFSYDLKIQSASQDFLKFLEFIGHKPEVYAQSTYRTARASMELSGTLNQIKLAVSGFSLDKTELEGILGMKRGRRNAFFAAIQSENINFDNYMPPLSADEQKLPPLEQAKVLINKLKFLNDVDMHAELSLKLGIYNKVPFENSVLNFDSEGGEIDIKKFEVGQIGNAAFSLEGKLKNLGINPSLENTKYKISTPDFKTFKNKLEINLPDWPLFNLSKNFESEGIFSGTLNNANIRSSAKLDKTNLSYLGRLFTQEDKLLFRGNLEIKAPDFVDFINQIDIDYNPANMGVSVFTFKADMEGRSSNWRAMNMNAFIGSNNFSGAFSYKKSDNIPLIKANIEANLFEFDRFIFSPKRKTQAPISKIKNAFLNKPSWDNTPMNYEPFKKFNLNGKFAIKNLSYLNDDIENVQFLLDVQNAMIDIKNFKATKNDVPIQADISIDATQKPVVKGTLDIKGYPIENIGGTVYNIENGKLNLKAKFEGPATSELDFIKSGQADISFDIEQPTFKGFDINLIEADLKKRTHSDGIDTFLHTALSSGQTAFKLIGGDLHFEGMKYTLSNALMDYPNATIDINATGSVEAWDTDTTFKLTLDNLKENIPAFTYQWQKNLSNPELVVHFEPVKNKYDSYWAGIEADKKRKEDDRITELTNKMNAAQAIVTSEIQIIESEILLRLKNYRPKAFDTLRDSIYEGLEAETNGILKNLKSLAATAHTKYNENDIENIIRQTEIYEPLLSELITQADQNYISDMKQHIHSAFEIIGSIYENSVEKSKNYQNMLNSYTMRLMQLGSLVSLNDLDEVKTNRNAIEKSIRRIAEIYNNANKIQELSDEKEAKIPTVDKLKKDMLNMRSEAQNELNTLNTSLEDLFEFIQDVVYFEQTGKQRRPKPQEKVQAPEEAQIQETKPELKKEPKPEIKTETTENKPVLAVMPSQTTSNQIKEQNKTKPSINTSKSEPEALVPKQPTQNEPVDVDLNLPKKFTQQETSTEQKEEPTTIETETLIIDEPVKEVIVAPEITVEEPEKIEIPLLIEIENDYASKPAISGSIIKKGRQTEKAKEPTKNSTPLLRPLTGDIAIEGTIKRK